jgi:glycosyltransferase involved in cell wall biosynthesis
MAARDVITRVRLPAQVNLAASGDTTCEAPGLPMPDPEITVIIPAHNAGTTVGETLAGLEAQRFDGRFEVILVDDGSDDETMRIAGGSPIVDRMLQLDRGGPARARNAGAAAAGAGRLAFLDADCRPVPGWLAAGNAALDAAQLVIGEARPPPGEPVGPFDRTLWVVGTSPLFESANMFVRRELFERLGGFESWLRPRDGKELGEDVWFGWRAMRSGAQVAPCPEALVHHAVHPRGPLGFAAERWRLRFFPAMARRMPELRTAFFHRRYFLSARAARFDAALIGLGLAGIARRPLLIAAAIPYAQVLARDLREPHGALLAPARVAADAVGFAALLIGSVRTRTLLL